MCFYYSNIGGKKVGNIPNNEYSMSKRQKSLFAADNSAVQKPKAAFATTFIATEIDKFHFEICLPNL